jgi:hypothetical protein
VFKFRGRPSLRTLQFPHPMVLYLLTHWGQCVIYVWGVEKHIVFLFVLFVFVYKIFFFKKCVMLLLSMSYTITMVAFHGFI